jgi:RNA polymerase sigma-70 factor (ECF subfamily)
VELTGDGGGKVPALARPLHGRSRVAPTLIDWVGRVGRLPDVSIRLAEINGSPGLVFLDGQGRLFGVWGLDVDGGRIRSVRSVVNPDKLAHLGPVGDFEALLRAAE